MSWTDNNTNTIISNTLCVSNNEASFEIQYNGSDTDSNTLKEEIDNFKKAKIGNYKKPERLDINKLKVEEYSKFEENWYGDGEKKFSEKTINKTLNTLKKLKRQPEVFPALDGSIQLEYESKKAYLQINVYEDYVEIYRENSTMEEEKKFNAVSESEDNFVINKINEYIKRIY